MLRLLDTQLPILMDRDEGCSVPSMFPPCSGEYSLDQLQIQKTPKSSTETMDNMEHNPMGNALLDMFVSSSQSLDKLSFADVMNFADYGSKVTLHQQEADEQNEAIARGSEQHGFDPIFFLKFPVLASDHKADEDEKPMDELASEQVAQMTSEGTCRGANDSGNDITHELNLSSNFSVDTLGSKPQNEVDTVAPVKQKRKRTRAVKNSEEVESQRMTHIAVERNRRKQMNEHLRVLRSLMPGSYVQRGDQASIIGGAIEFVRELEQLLQCLESQKRRRLYAEATTLQGACRPPPVQADPSSVTACVGAVPVSYPVFPVNSGDLKYLETGNLYDPSVMREEVADNKSPVADVEVKLLGYDAMIKILSQRRPGQLLKTILALETQLQFTIMHTNVTTIEQTVLYSFNVKVGGECKLSAEDIANSVQQIFNMIHASCMGYIKD